MPPGVVQCLERQGDRRVEAFDADEVVLVLGRHAEHEQDGFFPPRRPPRCFTAIVVAIDMLHEEGHNVFSRHARFRGDPAGGAGSARGPVPRPQILFADGHRRACCRRTCRQAAQLALDHFDISYGASFGSCRQYFASAISATPSDLTILGASPAPNGARPGGRRSRRAAWRRWITSRVSSRRGTARGAG